MIGRWYFYTIGIHALMAALVLLSSAAAAASFNYLYIEASEGNSSGGHTAIQFDDDIYHYQHLDSGLIRLFRREKAEFHFLYRYLQNRPIHESRVDVSEETFHLLKDQFKGQFLTQERQFKLLDDLHKERIFIRHLLHGLTADNNWLDADAETILQLKGVGLFYSDQGFQPQQTDSALTRQQSQSIEHLRQKIEQGYGPEFLHHRRAQIESEIKTLAPSHWPALSPDLSGELLTSPVYSFADRYSDYLTGIFAIKVLVEAPPLQSDAFLLMKQEAFKITEAEKAMLLDLRNTLEASLVKSVNSNRPDWGYAVLVNVARYIAVDASLQSGYWVFIDDFAGNSEWLRPDQYLQHSDQIRMLISDARTALERSRQPAMTGQRLTETEYSQIEMAGNRYFELLKSAQHLELRYNGEKALPARSTGFPDDPMPNLTREQLTTALAVLDDVKHSLFQKLKQDYRYDLINRNCVTELFKTVNRAVVRPYRSDDNLADPEALVIKESEKRLGGYVAIPYNFIPFVSYQSVLDRYHATHSRDLNSYRGLELAKLKSRENPVITALRESNIVSSRLYRYNPDDALFVFFTDDNWLLRPVFGVFNTAAGIGQSAYGIVSWPFDSGKNLKAGATGILMSLPELLFFNMRKGSYKYLSLNQLAKSDLFND